MPTDQIAITDAEIKAMSGKAVKEFNAILSAMGKAMGAWSMIENNLFEMFLTLSLSDNSQIGGVIFYSPNNMESRIRLVSDLMTYHFEWLRWIEKDDEILAAWASIQGKISALKNTRNAIAHGTLIHSARSLNDQLPRLSPAFGDQLRYLSTSGKGQHPGLGSAEIETHIAAAGRVNDRLLAITEVVQLRMRLLADQSPEVDQALFEKLSQLSKPS